MKPLFAVHAGEYLVGLHIESCYKEWNIWVPSKDTGIDLLVTDACNKKTVSLQVKYSKDFFDKRKPHIQTELVASGWWGLQEEKIKESKADLWVFVLPSFNEHPISFIIIPPDELLRRFKAIFHKPEKRLNSYLWVTKSGRCWEARGLKSTDHKSIATNQFENSNRDFTQFLNSSGWLEVEKRLR